MEREKTINKEIYKNYKRKAKESFLVKIEREKIISNLYFKVSYSC